MKNKFSCFVLSTMFLGGSALAAPEMNCTINRPGVAGASTEVVNVSFSDPYIREFPDVKAKLFIGFYEGQMQINLKDTTVTGIASNVASARTDYKNTDLVLLSPHWRLDVHCKRVEKDQE